MNPKLQVLFYYSDMSNRFEDKLAGAALKHSPKNSRRERITKPLTLKKFGIKWLLRKFTLLKFDMLVHYLTLF